jgi:hypothetical protein
MTHVTRQQKYRTAFYYECDPELNTKCIRKINNLPCGSCRKTRYFKFAKSYVIEVRKIEPSFIHKLINLFKKGGNRNVDNV